MDSSTVLLGCRRQSSLSELYLLYVSVFFGPWIALFIFGECPVRPLWHIPLYVLVARGRGRLIYFSVRQSMLPRLPRMLRRSRKMVWRKR
jgi:hypothetical protein